MTVVSYRLGQHAKILFYIRYCTYSDHTGLLISQVFTIKDGVGDLRITTSGDGLDPTHFMTSWLVDPHLEEVVNGTAVLSTQRRPNMTENGETKQL